MTDEFKIGDRVSEAFYGIGTVLNVNENGMLAVDFDEHPKIRNMHSCMFTAVAE